jgi:anoctamin-6
MAELRSTLAIILITQIVVGNFTEVILPWILNHLGALKNRVRSCCLLMLTRVAGLSRCSLHVAVVQCLGKQQPVLHALESEMTLPKYDPFGDYLEMLILYGYATLFVVAFPLAPLLALGNNLIEIRVDSFKLLYNSARPVPQGAQDIGAYMI